MRVVIDSGSLTSGDKIRGVGFYTRHLIDALEKLQVKNKFRLTQLDSRAILRNSSKYDVIHIPYFNPFFLTIPAHLSSKLVVTIHDVIPLLYSKQYPPGIRGRLRLWRQKERLKKVDAVITDSEASKKDIVRFLGVEATKIHVTHLAAGEKFRKITDNKRLNKVRIKYQLPKEFVLYVGDVNYNKNIPTLVEACRLAKTNLIIVGKQAKDVEQQGLDLQTLTGPRDWLRFLIDRPHPELAHYKKLLSLFREFKNGTCLGFVPDSDIVELYNLASVYCQPSFAEGFGLPVLEAMACGTPVVASKTQCLVEVAGDAALFADPRQPKEFANRIRKVLGSKSLSLELGELGKKRSAEYSWQKTAEETCSVYIDSFRTGS